MSSLCNHNKKFHSKNVANNNKNVANNNNNVVNNNENVVNNNKNVVNDISKNNIIINNDELAKTYNCIHCNKIFKSRQNKWVHQKNHCNNKNNIINDKNCNERINIIELEKIKLEQMNAENEMLRLKIKLQNGKKMDNKTFKAVNKVLMERSFKNSYNNNTNCNNTNNIVNNTINNNIILSLGDENLSDNLTLKEKLDILDRKYCSLEKITELVHCGIHDKFKNILITNLKDNYAYKYDDKLHYFLTVPKNELLNDVVSNRIYDIETIFNQLYSKINNETKKIIKHMLDKFNDDETTYYDHDNETKYDNYKDYKINNIKMILYNNSDKITRDIELLLSKYVNEKPIDI
jgi:hypothetical protein